jgi:hypothetical protein
VGPGERREPLELFGWLPLGETWGLEPLRLKRRIGGSGDRGRGLLARGALVVRFAGK